MPKKKTKTNTDSENTYGKPNYPYASTPSSLGRFLGMVPNKPRPEKVNAATIKAWGFRNTNDQSILRVLKAVDFIGSAGEPTKNYEEFMQPGKGPAILGRQIKKTYDNLFKIVTNPGSASHEDLRSFFNTYGGGSEKIVQLQIQTFRSMAGYATFGSSDPLEQSNNSSEQLEPNTSGSFNGSHSPAIRVDLHVHLPENKTKADYDSILESIAKHLYGKNI